jgi:predicted  nucleic acid-binding Zn-ribbon protein
MKAVAILVCLLAVASASTLKTKFNRYAGGVYDQQAAAPAGDDFPQFQEVSEEPMMQQQPEEAQQQEQQGGSFIPAIVNRGEQAAAPTILPPEPDLHTSLSSEQPTEDPMAQTLETDPELIKLNAALEAVKEDIIANGKQIADERKWVTAVLKITTEYQQKVDRVQAHIIELRKEMKKLYEKKKQIENLKLQRALEAKLKEANEELLTLQNSLKHVQQKHEDLNKSHMDLRATIASIEAQLAKLKGENPEKADMEEKEEVKEAVEADRLEEVSEKEEAGILGGEEEKEAMEM